MTGSHRCPGPGCARRVPAARLTCPACWRKVPAPFRAAVWTAWRDGEGAGSPEHTAAITAAIAQLQAGTR